VLTSLARQRILVLVAAGVAFDAAKTQAEGEVLAAFGIAGVTAGFESLNYALASNDGAKLLAASAIVQQCGVNTGAASSTVDAEVSLFVSRFSTDLADNGAIDAVALRDEIEDATNTIDAAAVRSHLTVKYQALSLPANIPDFDAWVPRTVRLPRSFDVSLLGSSDSEPSILLTPAHVPHVFALTRDLDPSLRHLSRANSAWDSEPVTRGDFRFPRAALGTDGTLYVSAGDGLFTKPPGESLWNVTSIAGGDIVNSTAVGVSANGAVAVAYLSEGHSPNAIRFGRLAQDGSVVSEPVADTGLQLQDSSIGHSVCMAFDSESVPHIFWNDRGTVTPGLRHATLANAGWDVTTLDDRLIDGGCSVRVLGDVFHIAYRDVTTRSAPSVRYATLSGATLTQVFSVLSSAQTIALVTTSSEVPAMITYAEGGVSLIAKLNAISVVRRISPLMSLYFDAAVDRETGSIHVVFEENGSDKIWYAVSQ
jgi:hypothetical protein